MKPLLSIITPVYNMASSIKHTIESVKNLKERYSNIEIEYNVIDGSSTDGTTDVVKEYHALGVVDRYLSERDTGVYNAMNKGLNMACGEYVLIIGADDRLIFQNFDPVFELLLKDKPDVCYGNQLMVSRDRNRVVRKFIAGPFKPYKIKFGWHPPHQSTIVKKQLLVDLGGFNERYEIAADIEMHWKVFSKAQRIVYVEKYLSIATIGGLSNKNFKHILKANMENLEIAKNLRFPFPLIAVSGKMFWKFLHVLDARFRPIELQKFFSKNELNTSKEKMRE